LVDSTAQILNEKAQKKKINQILQPALNLTRTSKIGAKFLVEDLRTRQVHGDF